MQVSHYKISTDGRVKLKIALVSDLHGRPYEKCIAALKAEKPDIICAVGDIVENSAVYRYGLEFLTKCSEIAPVYFVKGNHESKLSCSDGKKIKKAVRGMVEYCDIPFALTPDMPEMKGKISCPVHIGGMRSEYCINEEKGKEKTNGRYGGSIFRYYLGDSVRNEPLDEKRIVKFSSLDGYKILLCHHPEYYDGMIEKYDVDLVLSGHAHGGQIRIFGFGIFSPGQHFFPKYTSGVYKKRLVVGRGLSNHTFVPRIFNPCETVIIELE